MKSKTRQAKKTLVTQTPIVPVAQPDADQHPTDIVVTTSLKYNFAEITDPALKELVLDARVQAIRLFHFCAFMIMSTAFVQCEELPTACATIIGKTNTVVINPKFFSTILTSAAQRTFVVMHALMHLFLYHIGRQTENCYHPMLWNIATDYMINAFLWHMDKDTRRNNTSRIMMPSFALFDDRFYKKSADEIYHLLLKESDGNANKAAQKHGGGGDITVVIQGGGGKNGQPSQMPLDEVGRDVLSTSEKTALNRVIAASLSAQKNSNNKNIGNTLGDMFRLFNEYLEEKVNWKDVLREYIVSVSKTRTTYNRYNRRSDGGVIFPSLTGDHVNILFAADTSGSMSASDLGEVRSELASIMANFESWEIDVVSCDVAVNSIGHYATEDGDTFENVSMDMKGGGGTDMNPVVHYANDEVGFSNTEGETVTIILTDGYMPDIVEEPQHPTIIVLTTRSAENFKTKNDKITVIKMDDKANL